MPVVRSTHVRNARQMARDLAAAQGRRMAASDSSDAASRSLPSRSPEIVMQVSDRHMRKAVARPVQIGFSVIEDQLAHC